MVFDSDSRLDVVLDESLLSCHNAGCYARIKSKTINPPLQNDKVCGVRRHIWRSYMDVSFPEVS